MAARGVDYAPATIDAALLTLALNGGNADAAHRDLTAAGIERVPSARTLRNWRETQRYAEIQQAHAAEIRKHAISRFQEGALLNLQLARAAALQALTEAEAGELKDAGKTLQNATIAAGVAVDKALLLNGEPTLITQARDPKQAAQALARRLGVVLGQAEDITDVTLLPESADDNACELTPSAPAD